MLALLVSMMMFGYDPSVLSVPTAYAQEKEWTITEMKTLATEEAREHHLNVEHFLKVIECESGWNPKAIGDDGLSHGLAQLYYPTRDWSIATSSAYEPEIALEIMATAWEKAEHRRWTCWRMYYETPPATPPTTPSLSY